MLRLTALAVAVVVSGGCGDDSAGNRDAAPDAPANGCGVGVGTCNAVAQDCVGSGRCALDSTNMLFCASDPGSAPAFQGCTISSSGDDCQKGLVCLHTGSELTCRKFCCGDSDCSPNYCAISIVGTPLFACAQACSVLGQNCSTAGEA